MPLQLRTVLRKIRELRAYDGLTREEFEAARLKPFRELVRYANERSAYYAEIIKQRSIRIDSCTPQDFPPLTKSLLMANFDRIATDRRITKQGIADFLTRSKDPKELYLEEFRVLHTSGTSGEVGYFVYSQADWAGGVAKALRQPRQRPQRKRKFGRFRIAFYGATGGHFAGVTMASSASSGLLKLMVDMRVYEVNSPLPAIIQQLNAFQPEFLSGYTTALKMLADKQREGSLRIAPLVISAGGETVTEADRAVLKDAFGCEVSSNYACTEHLAMGVSRPGQQDMTLLDDDLIFEFYPDHSLITNLFNRTLPLIRYRMSDILQPLPPTPGSRVLRIQNIVGRSEQVPTFKNRDGVMDFISPHTINEIFVAGVTRFQMRLRDASSFAFAVCLDSSLDDAQRAAAAEAVAARLREILQQKQMENVSFEVQAVDDIPVNARTRKFQLIVNEASMPA